MSNTQAFDDWSKALLDPTQPRPSGLRVWNGSGVQARLAVHQNNVVAGLVAGLAAGFPVVQQLVGEDFFRAMAAAFVRSCPPRSPVLALYGDGFADFIGQFRPADGLPYLADMARLEWARTLCLHSADAEALDANEVSAALASLGHDEAALGQLTLTCHPSTRLVQSDFAVVSLWAVHQMQEDSEWGELDLDHPESALLLRVEWDVQLLPISRGVAVFIGALLQAAPLAIAASLAQESDRGFDLAASLKALVAHGGLVQIGQ